MLKTFWPRNWVVDSELLVLVDEHETDRFFLPADKKAEMSLLALELLS